MAQPLDGIGASATAPTITSNSAVSASAQPAPTANEMPNSGDNASRPRPIALVLAEKVPFSLTLIFSALAWLCTYTLGRYEDTPIIEYTISEANVPHTSGKSSAYDIEIRNASIKQVVKCAKLQFDSIRSSAKGAGSALGLSLARTTPAFIGTTVTKVRWSDEEGFVALSLDSMQPESGLRFGVVDSGGGGIQVGAESCEKGETAPLLKERSFETRILRHSLTVLWVAFFALTFAILLMLFRAAAAGALGK